MNDLRHRNRLVVFRVTQEEYEALQHACTEEGARTLSDFTRSRLLGEARIDAGSKLHDRFIGIEQQLVALQMVLNRFNHLLDERLARLPASILTAAEKQDPPL